MKPLISIVLFALVACGCSTEPAGPTYAEAVATYQAEVALLDSLLAKRKAIEDEYFDTVEKERRSFVTNDRHGAAFDSAASRVRDMSVGGLDKILSNEESSSDVSAAFERLLARSRRSSLNQISEVDEKIAKQKKLVQAAESARNSLMPTR